MNIELAESQMQDAIEKAARRVFLLRTSRRIVLVDFGNTEAEALDNLVAMSLPFITGAMRMTVVKVGGWPKIQVLRSGSEEGRPWRAEANFNMEIT